MEESKKLLPFHQELLHIGDAIRSGKLKVEKIHLFLNLKLDLEKLLSYLEATSNESYQKEKVEGINGYEFELYSSLSLFLEES